MNLQATVLIAIRIPWLRIRKIEMCVLGAVSKQWKFIYDINIQICHVRFRAWLSSSVNVKRIMQIGFLLTQKLMNVFNWANTPVQAFS